MKIRKALAGTSAHANLTAPEYPGAPRDPLAEPTVYEWPEDGAVIEVAPEHVQDLLRIRDGGFSEVADDSRDAPDDSPGDQAEAEHEKPTKRQVVSQRRSIRETE